MREPLNWICQKIGRQRAVDYVGFLGDLELGLWVCMCGSSGLIREGLGIEGIRVSSAFGVRGHFQCSLHGRLLRCDYEKMRHKQNWVVVIIDSFMAGTCMYITLIRHACIDDACQ